MSYHSCYDKNVGYDVGDNNDGSDQSYLISFIIGLSVFFTQGLGPQSPHIRMDPGRWLLRALGLLLLFCWQLPSEVL